MEVLEILATESTPLILLNPKGTIEITGKCIPENSLVLWEKVNDWMTQYVKNSPSHTVFIIQIDYLNTSSSNEILQILYKLNDLLLQGKSAVIKWYYYVEDEDMKELGKDYANMLKVPFEILEIKQVQLV